MDGGNQPRGQGQGRGRLHTARGTPRRTTACRRPHKDGFVLCASSFPTMKCAHFVSRTSQVPRVPPPTLQSGNVCGKAETLWHVERVSTCGMASCTPLSICSNGMKRISCSL